MSAPFYDTGIIKKSGFGFTLIEVFIVVAILSVLSAVSIATFVLMQKKSDIDNVSQEFVTVVKLAQNKTLSSQQDSQYGVYINTAVEYDGSDAGALPEEAVSWGKIMGNG